MERIVRLVLHEHLRARLIYVLLEKGQAERRAETGSGNERQSPPTTSHDAHVVAEAEILMEDLCVRHFELPFTTSSLTDGGRSGGPLAIRRLTR